MRKKRKLIYNPKERKLRKRVLGNLNFYKHIYKLIILRCCNK